MDIEKIAKILAEGRSASARVNGYMYDFSVTDEYNYWVPNLVWAEPRAYGSSAYSDCDRNAYPYTHGCRVFREAVDVCVEIASIMKERGYNND